MADKELHRSTLDKERNEGTEGEEEGEEENEEGILPDALYQQKVMTRKDKRVTAGLWNYEGIARLNELSDKIKESRNSTWREAMESDLTERYANNANKCGESSSRKKQTIEESKILFNVDNKIVKIDKIKKTRTGFEVNIKAKKHNKKLEEALKQL